MATGQTENFPVHSKHHRLACSAKNGRKKTPRISKNLWCCRLVDIQFISAENSNLYLNTFNKCN